MSILTKFLVVFVPTCSIGAGGFWLARAESGLWCAVGWIVAVLFGIAAALEGYILASGLARMARILAVCNELQQRDADLFTQGKSFDEVLSQYKKPKP